MAESDLSQYELQRLERIRNNRALLAQIGVTTSSAALGVSTITKIKKKRPAPIRQVRKEVTPERPTRSSKRLRGAAAAVEVVSPEEDSSEEEAPGIDYSDIPVDTDGLDDFEFESYTMLRKWRLRRKNELQVEPFKIFQNRTLCDALRRRRNDVSWANTADVDERSNAMLQCWGVGAKKVDGCEHSSEGFAHELALELGKPELMARLEESRKKQLEAEAEASGGGQDNGTDEPASAAAAEHVEAESAQVDAAADQALCEPVTAATGAAREADQRPVPKLEVTTDQATAAKLEDAPAMSQQPKPSTDTLTKQTSIANYFSRKSSNQ